MRVGMAQINATLGDFSANRKKTLKFIRLAQRQACDLVIFPELSLMGYLPNDLLERSSIVEEQLREFSRLQSEIKTDMAVLVGLVTKSTRRKGKPYLNSVALLQKDRRPRFFHKELLPAYDVFDEARHSESGDLSQGFFSLKRSRCLLTICEDIWGWEIPDHPSNYMLNPLKDLGGKKVDFVINMSASPFTKRKLADRQEVVRRTARHFKAPMVYVNMVGGQDEIVFDGGSFSVSASGKVTAQCAYFEEDFGVVEVKSNQGIIRQHSTEPLLRLEQALVLGIRDFVSKTGLDRVHLGLSGGIDSAVAVNLAARALGTERVTAVTLPGPFSHPDSRLLAESLAKALGVRCLNFSILDTYNSLLNTLEKGIGSAPSGVVCENLQARIRGNILMALANSENSLLLSTSNKSEIATGFTTLYGDMCGGLAPLGDLLKEEVYALAHHFNASGVEKIPQAIIDREPSAELRPNQVDQDVLPPYPLLDASVRDLVELQMPARTETDKWALEALMKSEFKRWQSPPILKVSTHAFGRGRRMPIAHRAKW